MFFWVYEKLENIALCQKELIYLQYFQVKFVKSVYLDSPHWETEMAVELNLIPLYWYWSSLPYTTDYNFCRFVSCIVVNTNLFKVKYKSSQNVILLCYYCCLLLFIIRFYYYDLKSHQEELFFLLMHPNELSNTNSFFSKNSFSTSEKMLLLTTCLRVHKRC